MKKKKNKFEAKTPDEIVKAVGKAANEIHELTKGLPPPDTIKPPPHPGGRPTVFTPAVLQKLEEAYSWDCTDAEACFHAGVSESALYVYQEQNPEFKERKNALKQKPVLAIRQTVIMGIVGRAAVIDPKTKRVVKEEVPANPDLGLKYLERKKKDEFSVRVENTGKDGKPLNPKSRYDGMNRDELVAERERRAKIRSIKPGLTD